MKSFMKEIIRFLWQKTVSVELFIYVGQEMHLSLHDTKEEA